MSTNDAPDSALALVSNVADAVEVRDGLSVAQQTALMVLADGKPHYCWKWQSNTAGQGGRGCVNAKATSRLRTLHLARTVSYGDAFTGGTVEITDAGQAVYDGSVFA